MIRLTPMQHVGVYTGREALLEMPLLSVSGLDDLNKQGDKSVSCLWLGNI